MDRSEVYLFKKCKRNKKIVGISKTKENEEKEARVLERKDRFFFFMAAIPST